MCLLHRIRMLMGGGDEVAGAAAPVGLTVGGFVPCRGVNFAKQLQNQLKTLGRAGRKEL